MGICAQIILYAGTQCACPLAVDNDNLLQAGKVCIINIFVNICKGFIYQLPAAVNFRRNKLAFSCFRLRRSLTFPFLRLGRIVQHQFRKRHFHFHRTHLHHNIFIFIRCSQRDAILVKGYDINPVACL